jgi:hypothetical protein
MRVRILVLFILLNYSAYGDEAYNFLDLQWRTGEDEIEEAHVGDEVKIKFETTNIPDNETIDIEIWEQTDGKLMDFIAKLQGTVINGMVELNWIVEFDEDNENTNYAREIREIGYTFIDYVFIVKNDDMVISSKLLSIMSWIRQLVVNRETREPVRNQDYFIIAPDNEIIEGYTNKEGYIILDRLRKIGQYRIVI